MFRNRRSSLGWLVASIVIVAGVARWLVAQDASGAKAPVAAGRFQFEVVESFDAKYEGDTPGHIGRHGGLGDAAPTVALGDAVFRGDVKVGTVTGLTWGRATGSLEVEFDPEPKTRIYIGEQVWLQLAAQPR